MFENSNPLTEDELDFIDAVLHKYQTESSIHNASELDGFITALVSGPNMVMPGQWLPAIWSTDTSDKTPNWESDDEFTRFMSLVMQHMNDSIDMLMNDNEEFEAVFMNAEKGGRVLRIPNDWCFGYLRGMAVGGGWESLPGKYDEYISAIAIHTDPEMEAKLMQLDQDSLQDLVAMIEPAAQTLHRFWLEQRMNEPDDFMSPQTVMPPQTFMPQQTVHYDQPKVGRNDPCPCGSGKKYKKCCLH